VTIYRELQDSERRDRLVSGGAKHVRTRSIVQVKGPGRYKIENPIMFGVAYQSKPDLTTLVEEVTWDDDYLPNVAVGIRRWVRDRQGNYVGAYIWIGVT
jgi:hypothetical protein